MCPDFVRILVHCQGFCSALFSLASSPCSWLLLLFHCKRLCFGGVFQFCSASLWELWGGKTGPSRGGRIKAAQSRGMLRVQVVQQGWCILWPLKKKPTLKIACQSLEGYDELHLKKWSLESLSFCKWRWWLIIPAWSVFVLLEWKLGGECELLKAWLLALLRTESWSWLFSVAA